MVRNVDHIHIGKFDVEAWCVPFGMTLLLAQLDHFSTDCTMCIFRPATFLTIAGIIAHFRSPSRPLIDASSFANSASPFLGTSPS